MSFRLVRDRVWLVRVIVREIVMKEGFEKEDVQTLFGQKTKYFFLKKEKKIFFLFKKTLNHTELELNR